MVKMLKDRVGIVTGAGRGIGRGIAILMAKEGAKVVVNDMGGHFDGTGTHHGPADEVVKEIREFGGEAIPNYESVTDFAGAKRIIDSAINAFGKLDILVNNAGILRDRMVFNMSEEDWDAVVSVHLKGSFNCLRHACTYWREEHKAGKPISGRLINMTSDAGMLFNPGQTNYGAAKAGIIALALITAKEMVKYGVTCNVVAPMARTRLTVDATPQTAGVMGKPEDFINKIGYDPFDPDNIAPLVVYLASEDAKDITGQVFRIAGGVVWLLQSWQSFDKISKKGRWTPQELGPKLKDLVQKAPPREDFVKIYKDLGLVS
jgi:NAD(P)-dependent dehydrogenase (short-subunit alcohol dehydrogenase family)